MSGVCGTKQIKAVTHPSWWISLAGVTSCIRTTGSWSIGCSGSWDSCFSLICKNIQSFSAVTFTCLFFCSLLVSSTGPSLSLIWVPWTKDIRSKGGAQICRSALPPCPWGWWDSVQRFYLCCSWHLLIFCMCRPQMSPNCGQLDGCHQGKPLITAGHFLSQATATGPCQLGVGKVGQTRTSWRGKSCRVYLEVTMIHSKIDTSPLLRVTAILSIVCYFWRPYSILWSKPCNWPKLTQINWFSHTNFFSKNQPISILLLQILTTMCAQGIDIVGPNLGAICIKRCFLYALFCSLLPEILKQETKSLILSSELRTLCQYDRRCSLKISH